MGRRELLRGHLKDIHGPANYEESQRLLTKVVTTPLAFRSSGRLFMLDGHTVTGERIALPVAELDQWPMSVQDTNKGSGVPNLEVAMPKRLYEFYCVLFILATGASSVDVSSAQARPEQEQVTVDSPYTIRQQVLNRPIATRMKSTRISVDQKVSFSDLDFSKPGDITTARERIRDAARDSCQELYGRFSPRVFIPLNDNCVREATSQAFAQLDEILMPSVR